MKESLKIVIINKSDSTGGAAIVSRRLMEALREKGADATMLVTEKLSDSPYIEKAASAFTIKRAFLWERLKIYLANGCNRTTLFKIDTGAVGLHLWNHPSVKEADVLLINWTNQGMLSLKGIKRLLKSGKPLIITMHDMWFMTGICHHAGECDRYKDTCGDCPLLGKKSKPHDLSYRILRKKSKLYNYTNKKKEIIPLSFVAVSNWLAKKSSESFLLKDKQIHVIPNAFKTDHTLGFRKNLKGGAPIRILIGAARLDDPIKGLDIFKEALKIIKEEYPGVASRMEVAVFGTVKNEKSIEGFPLPLKRLGVLKGEEEIKRAYIDSHILVSSSLYETLPGTLVEAQAYGCIPVAFDRGGQRDIIEPFSTGYLAHLTEDSQESAANLAKGIIWAETTIRQKKEYEDVLMRMRKNVEKKFSYDKIAEQYLKLINDLTTEGEG